MRSLRVSMVGVYRIDKAGIQSAGIKTAPLGGSVANWEPPQGKDDDRTLRSPL
jgi:hypothetical protein